MEEQEIFPSRIDLKSLNQTSDKIREELKKVIVGQDKVLDLLLVAILSNGHVLIEGVPGIAKTLVVKLLAKTISTGFSRIQFTPDLMPSDVLGTSVFNMSKSAFEFNRGPIFSNLILIDEINRAPAKTQSALFEVMEERQVSMDGKTYHMEPPFLVFATQNPIEHEGTYRLPEAQLDRFLFKIEMGYPNLEEEVNILKNSQHRKGKPELEEVGAVVTSREIVEFQQKVRGIHAEEKLQQYIAKIVNHTRNDASLYLGASPRASLAILNASKALAAISGRDFITPDDVKEVVVPVLHHRIILSPEKEMEGVKPAEIIQQIIEQMEVPR